MPNQTVSTLNAALEAAARLAELRRSQADCVMRGATTERDFAYARALGEKAIIDAAGGEASLGKNEAARERAFTIGLAEDPDHLEAIAALAETEAERRLVDVDVKLASDRLNVLLAALGAGILEVDAALLADSLADQPADQALWPAPRIVVFDVAPGSEMVAAVTGGHA